MLVPDNLKTGVTANTRYETQLNESYRELAEYYGTAIVPARVRKPQDKGLVERSVGFSTTWITAALREQKFFSFAEVKDAVSERLEIIWIRKVKIGSLDIGCGERSPEESLNIAEENQQLRKRIKALEKENKRLSEMNEFLEDAAAFFAACRMNLNTFTLQVTTKTT